MSLYQIHNDTVLFGYEIAHQEVNGTECWFPSSGNYWEVTESIE